MRFIAYLQPKDSASARRWVVVALCICATLGTAGWMSAFVRPTPLGFEMAFGGIMLTFICLYILLPYADPTVYRSVKAVFGVSISIALPLLGSEYLLRHPQPRWLYFIEWTCVLVAVMTGVLLFAARERFR